MSLPTLFIKGKLKATKWSEPQANLDKHRPLDYIMDWFSKRLPSRLGGSPPPAKSPADKIMILRSSTGSGKSAVMPPEFYHRFQEITRKNIAVTEPRIFNAVDVPTTSIIPFNTKEYLKSVGLGSRTPLVLGVNIGYKTGELRKPLTERGLIFMTVGLLQAQLNVMSEEDFMNTYSIIIIDEVHERQLGVDAVLYTLKKFIAKNYANKNCPFLVVTSATFDTILFADYLLSSVPAPQRYKNIIEVEGFAFPLDEHFLEYDSSNYIWSTVDTVIKIHTENPQDFLTESQLKKADLKSLVQKKKPRSKKRSGRKKHMLREDRRRRGAAEQKKLHFRDILIFVSGSMDIRSIKTKINRLNGSHPFFRKYPVLPLELTGDVVAAQTSEYKKMFEDIGKLTVQIYSQGKVRLGKPVRRVIIATNVGETGITYPTLKYVVDTGWYKTNEYNPNFNVEALVEKPVTQGKYRQRIGRSNRRGPGVSYAMYTKKTFDLLMEDAHPDIAVEDITREILGFIVQEADKLGENNEKELVELFKKDFMKKLSEQEVNLYDIDLLSFPSADSMHSAMEKLFVLGTIDVNSSPTKVGLIMNKMRKISMESSKMILSGYAWGAPIIDLITMASFLYVGKRMILHHSLSDKYQAALNAGVFSAFPDTMPFYKNSSKISRYQNIKTELLVADDFLQFIFIFRKFMEVLSDVDAQEWCEQHGIMYSGLVGDKGVIRIRDEIIQNLANIGLNPYANFDKSIYNIANYTDVESYVSVMKQCIFEGYKFNLAVWNPFTQQYIVRKTHIPINVKSGLIQNKLDISKNGDSNPQFIIFDNILYQNDSETNMYITKVQTISVMDGFISIDKNFDTLI